MDQRWRWVIFRDPWPLHHFIGLGMGLGGGVAWWYWTTLSILRAKNCRLKLNLQLHDNKTNSVSEQCLNVN